MRRLEPWCEPVQPTRAASTRLCVIAYSSVMDLTERSARPTARPRQVLVVDDEPVIRDVLGEALRSAGYNVTTASNGRAALAVLDGVTPDVIVLDLMMPVMDGFAFRARQLLSARLAGIPVIVLSATYQLESVAKALRAHALLTKPFDLDVVLDRVATACGAAD